MHELLIRKDHSFGAFRETASCDTKTRSYCIRISGVQVKVLSFMSLCGSSGLVTYTLCSPRSCCSIAGSIGNSSFAVDTQMSSWTLLRTGLTYIPSFYMCLNAYISSQRFYVISIRFFHKFPNFDNNGKEL